MEQASQAASRALSSERSEPRAEPDSEIVAWMWQALVQMYGSAVLTLYGDEHDAPCSMWRQALSRLTRDEAKKGLASLAREKRTYPPNLTEVLEACRPKKLVRYYGVPETREQLQRRIGVVKAPREVVERHLQSIRSKLGSRA
jgi:hypothetical protein